MDFADEPYQDLVERLEKLQELMERIANNLECQ